MRFCISTIILFARVRGCSRHRRMIASSFRVVRHAVRCSKTLSRVITRSPFGKDVQKFTISTSLEDFSAPDISFESVSVNRIDIFAHCFGCFSFML